MEQIRAALPELPWLRRDRLQADWGFTDLEMRDLVAAAAVELLAATVDAGAPPAAARSWWTSYLGQQANARGVGLAELLITPAQLAAVIGKVDVGRADHQVGPTGRRRRAGRRG